MPCHECHSRRLANPSTRPANPLATHVAPQGEDFVKNGTPVSLVYRMATVLDVRDMAAPKRTRELWKSGGGGGEGRGRGGRGGRGGKRRFQRGGGEGGEGEDMDVDEEAEGPGDGMVSERAAGHLTPGQEQMSATAFSTHNCVMPKCMRVRNGLSTSCKWWLALVGQHCRASRAGARR